MNVNIRKQGGAAVITLPVYVLKTLNLRVGQRLQVSVEQDALVARPMVEKKPRARYTLSELLQGTTVEEMRELNTKMAWARAGRPVGRELS